MPPSSAWMSASTIIMRPPTTQEMIAAGPAAIRPSCAPNSQPEPMMEPTEAHIRPIMPTSRLREVECRAGFSAKDMSPPTKTSESGPKMVRQCKHRTWQARLARGKHVAGVAGAAALVGGRPGGRSVRRRALRAGQPQARRLRRVAAAAVPGRAPTPDRAVAAVVHRSARGGCVPGRRPGCRTDVRVRRAVRGAARSRPRRRAAGRRGSHRVRRAVGRRLHLRARHLRVLGRVAGELRRDGHVLRGRGRRDPRRTPADQGCRVNATQRWSTLAVGVTFGFFLTASGLGNYRTIHDGLLLRDPYIYLMMASTVATAGVGLALLRR